ncbi:signal recognition particle-docking protein FtsY [Limosilactobacillus sp.]|uniref:signal recognition particle-docking protein FtsY n=1 Tax=Limosilactobacillus sp. TaxID=2773925 RepID=UPI00345EBDA8
MGLFDIFRRHRKKDEKKQSESASVSVVESLSEQFLSSVSLSQASAAEASDQSQEHSESVNSTSVAVSTSFSTETSESVAGQSLNSESNSVSLSQTQSTTESVAPSVSESALESESQSNSANTQETAAEQKDEDQEDANQTVEKKYDAGLAKSRHGFGARLNRFLANFRHVDEDFFDDLEDLLIESDVGVDMTTQLSDELRDEVKLQNAKTKQEVSNVIIEKMVDLYEKAGKGENSAINFAKEGPTVIMFVGVNGAGKTTTIGKMAAMYKRQGKKVILAAADTFRAGATEQLDVWAKRDGVDIVTGPENGDPAAVVYDAVKKAQSENYDILLVDTAGRLQNKVNLMKELAKMKRVLTREIPAAPHEVLLVVDATTGQNALSQAKLFKQNTDVTGIILTKLDGTARGGIVLAIRNELHLPVKYVGLGEKVDDLQAFNAEEFVYGLFKGLVTTN